MNTQSMIEKIRALLAKTVDAGCTEAEAMMAASKAAQLMDQYELSPDAVSAGASKASAEHYQRSTLQHSVRYCAHGVAAFTGTKIYSDSSTQHTFTENLFGERTMHTEPGKYLRIVGLPHEVEIAGYILDICVNALDTAAAKALVAENAERGSHAEPLLVGGERKAWVESFQRGMAARMSTTLNEMARERNSNAARLTAAKGDGKSLSVIRTDLIADWFRDNGITLHAAHRSAVGNRSGFNAGHAAGGGVRFHAGMASGQRASLAIGG